MTAIITHKTKRSTDEMISGAIDRQQTWRENRRYFAGSFLRKLNVFRAKKEAASVVTNTKKTEKLTENESVLRAYWFPILCALIVILIAVFVVFFKTNSVVNISTPAVPEPIIKPVDMKQSYPTFDIVRIDKFGKIVIAGRGVKKSNVSIMMNNTVVATEYTDKKGEFVYAPANALKSGNYTISLINADNGAKSGDKVFVYVPENYENAVSLLMNENGSKILQSPQSSDGDLTVSTIDYLDSGRLVVTGRALPRLRVSLMLNNKYLGFARVSDYKNYGLGIDVGTLTPGNKYVLTIRLHDTHGTTIATKTHEFVMPAATGTDDTYYTVRRGDSLWIIARNFLRRGVLFSIIADCNNIKNPNLIYPHQILQIPVK